MFVTDTLAGIIHNARERHAIRKPKHFYVYIMTNGPRSHVLYAGITGNLPRRVFEHKSKLSTGFTSRYNLTRLVITKCLSIRRRRLPGEMEIKGWRRSKKIALIQAMNPHWHDLAAEWQDLYKPVNGFTLTHARSFTA